MTQIERMVAFVNEHDPCEALATVDGRLHVITDERDSDGQWSRVQETIPATWQAVRDWLGY